MNFYTEHESPDHTALRRIEVLIDAVLVLKDLMSCDEFPSSRNYGAAILEILQVHLSGLIDDVCEAVDTDVELFRVPELLDRAILLYVVIDGFGLWLLKVASDEAHAEFYLDRMIAIVEMMKIHVDGFVDYVMGKEMDAMQELIETMEGE